MTREILPNPEEIDWDCVFTVKGEPCSKANSRRLVTHGGKPRFIKSKKALAYVDAFQWQCPKLQDPLEGDLIAWIDIWYGSLRPDLDESVILDAMQGLVYKNDRQVKLKVVRHHLDRADPRCVVRLGVLP